MDMVSQEQIIGIDVSRDCLDIHCLADGSQLRIANTAQGHEQLVEVAHDRRALRHVMFQAALVASRHNSVLKNFADKLRKRGKPHKVITTAVARKLVTIVNALCKSRQKWEQQTQ